MYYCIVYKDGKTEHVTSSNTLPNMLGKQPNGIVTYSIQNSSGDIPDNRKEVMAINYAISQWGLRLKNITFKKVPYGTPNTKIIITFLKPGDPQYTDLFPNDNILEMAYYPTPENGALAGHVFFNDDFRVIWSLDGKPILCTDAVKTGHATGCQYDGELLQTYKMTTIVRHGVGHALGLQHMPDSGNTMYAYYDGMADKLGPEDIKVSTATYGDRNLPQTYIDSLDNLISREVGLI